jgi:hypothetical protein
MAREIGSDELTKRQKFRAQRIDHDYHAKPHAWRSRMKLLSILAPLFALAAVGAYAVLPSGERLFLPGHVSTKHASFADRCAECHEQGAGPGKWGAVTDAKCVACHDGPLHSTRQAYHGLNAMDYQVVEIKNVNGKEIKEVKQLKVENASCASCHSEHHDNIRLTEIHDRHCTQCHSNLPQYINDKNPPLAADKIHSFSDGHPDWDALGQPDQAKVKFGHALHMTKKKAGAQTTLQCSDCHEPDNSRAYMKPVLYSKHCQECHPLDVKVSDVVGTVRLPHEDVKTVRDFVKASFSDAIIKAGGTAPGKESPNPAYDKLNRIQKQSNDRKKDDDPTKIPKTIKDKDPRPPEKWVADNIDDAMKIIYAGADLEGEKAAATSSCYYCHMAVDKKIETVAPTKIPEIWLPRSIFDHEVHRVLTCVSCHTNSASSTKTADVMLPNIKSCQDCHHPTGARSGCNECHLYHTRIHQKAEGVMSIEDLMKGRKSITEPAKTEAKKDEAAKPAEEPKKEEPKKEEPAKAEEAKK